MRGKKRGTRTNCEHTTCTKLWDLLEAIHGGLSDHVHECFENTRDQTRRDVTNACMRFDQKEDRFVHVRSNL